MPEKAGGFGDQGHQGPREGMKGMQGMKGVREGMKGIAHLQCVAFLTLLARWTVGPPARAPCSAAKIPHANLGG